MRQRHSGPFSAARAAPVEQNDAPARSEGVGGANVSAVDVLEAAGRERDRHSLRAWIRDCEPMREAPHVHPLRRPHRVARSPNWSTVFGPPEIGTVLLRPAYENGRRMFFAHQIRCKRELNG